MATVEDLQRLQTELRVCQARHELALKVRTRQLVAHHASERVVIGFGQRLRHHLLSAPSRYAAILAAEHDIDSATLTSGIDAILHEWLTHIAAMARRA